MFVMNGIAYADEPRRDNRIAEARYVGNLQLVITFSSGESRLLDLTDFANYPAFVPLQEESAARNFQIDHGVITWMDGNVDISPDAAYKRSYEYEEMKRAV
ncbi:MAG: DUF2442 domain-containing protein [Olegusella sp.]|nr:DUF2442 domain-containing protein [Olegusella sp.]